MALEGGEGKKMVSEGEDAKEEEKQPCDKLSFPILFLLFALRLKIHQFSWSIYQEIGDQKCLSFSKLLA